MNTETLFHQALAKGNPEERAAFLGEACAGQPELRAAVEALLAAHEASGGFTGKPPTELGETIDSEPTAQSTDATDATGEFTPTPPDASQAIRPQGATTQSRAIAEADTVIAGRYILEEMIGEGGMGEVWVAQQTEPVKRKVALKLIKPGMDSVPCFALRPRAPGPGDPGSSQHRQGA